MDVPFFSPSALRTSASLAIAVALAGTALPAHAEWSPLGDNNIGSFFVDKNSIVSTRSIRQAQILLNWSRPQLLMGQGSKTYYTSEISTAYFDCSNHQLGFGSRKMYAQPDGKGTLLLAPQLAYSDVKLQDPIPGSTGERAIDAVCGK
ncbi:surface-adhesin E family protein [Herbaspirillum chlorophenolicum]|uniref:Surface-adhesin E family protein n=1 Tax=Herbaspirillum chlorophenolicum TaxID=211589 RepID=A0ABW8EVU0_9BURK|nr:surface-adhesin E family protein [Herbaspirillum chlorophenolicum]